jgi:anaerobic selenocysteine-containing dehydrogenase
MVTGHGALAGERMTGALADQILLDGPEQVRALFVNGANLAVSAPNQRRFVEALRSLELLVTCEHFLTPTAELSDYVIPATTAFERPDLLFPPPYEQLCDIPFSQYIPPALPPPDEALDEWRVFWGLGRRLGLNLAIRGRPVDMTTPPQTDQLLALAIEGGRVSLDELRAAPDGVLLEEEVRVLPARPSCTGRLHVAPQDVIDELAQVGCEGFPAGPGFRLTARRLRGVMNSLGIGWETARREREDNPAYLHPDDMASLDLVAGDRIEIASEFGAIEATVAPDGGLRPGVVAMAHAWGGLPDGEGAASGSNTNLLVGTDRGVEPINAMPAMSAIPVKIAKAGRQVATVPPGSDRRATT